MYMYLKSENCVSARRWRRIVWSFHAPCILIIYRTFIPRPISSFASASQSLKLSSTIIGRPDLPSRYHSSNPSFSSAKVVHLFVGPSANNKPLFFWDGKQCKSRLSEVIAIDGKDSIPVGLGNRGAAANSCACSEARVTQVIGESLKLFSHCKQQCRRPKQLRTFSSLEELQCHQSLKKNKRRMSEKTSSTLSL